MTQQPFPIPASTRRRPVAGFSLVEMAVVVVLMGLLLGLGLRTLRATQESAAWSETKAKQERIKTALIAHLRSKGRLPCPDAALPPTGVEPAACLVNAGRGVLPWQTLGLSMGDVQDGWANYFTYRVANRTPATATNWTLKGAAPAAGPFTIAEFTTPLTAFTLQQRSDAGVLGAAITPNPVVMLISHGKNGSGARTRNGPAVIPLPAGADELANAGAASTSFVMRSPTEDSAATGGAFDDIVAFMTPQDLLGPLVGEKTLIGACQAYCAAPAAGCAATGIPIGNPTATCP